MVPPHSQIVSNAQPFLDGLDKIQQAKANSKKSKFIKENLNSILSPAAPQSTRNIGKSKSKASLMADSLNSKQRGVVKRQAGTDFILYNNKAPIKGIRFPKLAEELKKQEKERMETESAQLDSALPANLISYLEGAKQETRDEFLASME